MIHSPLTGRGDAHPRRSSPPPPRLRIASLLAIVVAAACAEAPDNGSGDAIAEVADTGAVDTAIADNGGASDVEAADAQLDAAPADTPPPDTAASCPGGPGCACAANADCDAGQCLETPPGKACAPACVDACPAGFRCAAVPQGADVVQVCVSAWARLCSPCTANADCNHPGVTDGRCVDRGAEGGFCGAGCKGDGDCPSGHGCKQAKDVAGNATSQCLPVDGAGVAAACVCSDNAVALALETGCSKTLVSGQGELVCAGKAACKAIGDAALCLASDPAAEVCNGKDDDCDGVTDEGACDDGKACTTDACDVEAGKCVYAPVKDGTGCDADGSACTENDACLGGACVAGKAKSCDDKNPCTKDSCDLAAGCTQVADDGVPCDDENPCTIGDVCKAGGCVAGKAKECTSTEACIKAKCDLTQDGKCAFKNKKAGTTCDDGDACTKDDGCQDGACEGSKLACDDANPCTDDSCDVKSGCVYKPNAAPCDDGDKCTLLDKCAAELCKPGQAKACDDGEACTADGCDKKTGDCTFSSLPMDAIPCDADGSVCSEDDTCQAGKCVAG